MLIVFVVTAVIFVALDAAWLTVMGDRVYRPALGALMRAQVAFAPTAVFYVIYSIALTALVVLPALQVESPARAFVYGLIFGLAAYGTYNLTNASTLVGWPPHLVVIDMAWGTVLTGVAAWLATLIAPMLREIM
jgi:uncharacterized membrane protein